MNSPCALYNCDETFLPLSGTIKRLTQGKMPKFMEHQTIFPYYVVLILPTWTSLNDNPLLVVITLLMKRHS